MTVSVCMGIYNGEKYIEKQLQTILDQSRPADEVVLCDDGSTDGTIEIVKRFIEDRRLKDTWKLYQNEENKGYPGNFYYAMGLCCGDIVFLADQDDIWETNKLEKMTNIMEAHETICLLASRWGIIDQNDKVLKEISRGNCSETDALTAVSIRDILYCYDWPGMCMCYRKSLGDRVLEQAKDARLAHDVALGLAAAEMAAFYCADQRNQFHRRHDANVAREEHRVLKLLDKKRKVYEIGNYLQMLDRILASKVLTCKDNILIIEQKKKIMQERMDNLREGHPFKIIKQYVKHRREIRWATMICDLVICKTD